MYTTCLWLCLAALCMELRLLKSTKRVALGCSTHGGAVERGVWHFFGIGSIKSRCPDTDTLAPIPADSDADSGIGTSLVSTGWLSFGNL